MAHEELRAALETLHLPLHTGTVDDPHWSREIRTAQGSIAWCGASDGRAIAAAIVRAVNAAPELLRERDAHKQASELSAAALRGVSEELARVTAERDALAAKVKALGADALSVADLRRCLDAVALVQHIRCHAKRHDLERDWLTKADKVIDYWNDSRTADRLQAAIDAARRAIRAAAEAGK